MHCHDEECSTSSVLPTYSTNAASALTTATRPGLPNVSLLRESGAQSSSFPSLDVLFGGQQLLIMVLEFNQRGHIFRTPTRRQFLLILVRMISYQERPGRQVERTRRSSRQNANDVFSLATRYEGARSWQRSTRDTVQCQGCRSSS